jgi:hypothetical protein
MRPDAAEFPAPAGNGPLPATFLGDPVSAAGSGDRLGPMGGAGDLTGPGRREEHPRDLKPLRSAGRAAGRFGPDDPPPPEPEPDPPGPSRPEGGWVRSVPAGGWSGPAGGGR